MKIALNEHKNCAPDVISGAGEIDAKTEKPIYMRDLLEQAQELVTVVKSNGSVFANIKAVFQSKQMQFIIADSEITLDPGDEIRRPTRGNNEEVWIVEEPNYRKIPVDMSDFGRGGDFYHPTVRRSGSQRKGEGGNYNITVSGAQARVNIDSTDNSVNQIDASSRVDVVEKIRATINELDIDEGLKAEATAKLDALENATDKASFLDRYSQFVQFASAHATIWSALAAHIPALTGALGN